KVVSNDGIRQLESRPELQLVPPNIRLLWPLFVQQLRKGLTYEGDDYPERIAALNSRMVQTLNDANADIILGTDTDNPYLIPGLSALEELELLVEAGLTPYQALAAGTSNAAAALGHPGEFGIVAVGARADLLLLNQNPLKSISHVYDRAGVMINGRWLPEAELHQMRAELVESYESEWIDWVWAVLVMGTAVVMIIIRTIKLKKVD
ncbi:MAG: amidohydrolase family protein, partial [Chloroflexi bacterium]|nr:amidohydrolase family protein [Chloroflexota bacterium]